VSENGASKNILKKGDVITKIEGLEFSTKIQFQKELYDKTKGENVTLTIYRNNSYQEVIVTLN
jgi:S1-C subfamily serine protease